MRQKAINSIKFSVNVEDEAKKNKKNQKEDVREQLSLSHGESERASENTLTHRRLACRRTASCY